VNPWAEAPARLLRTSLRTRVLAEPALQGTDKTVTVMNPGGAGAPRFGCCRVLGYWSSSRGYRRGGGLWGWGGRERGARP